MKLKKSLSLALAAALTLSLAAPALAAAPEGWTPADGARTAEPWYAEAQAYVAGKGIMTGTDKGFEPDATVTRATVFHTLWNMEGQPVVEAPTEHLLQLNEAASGISGWWASSARWAYHTGLTVGDDGFYQGDRAITRAELVVALHRYAELKGTQLPVVAENAPDPVILQNDFYVPQWAVEDFYWAIQTGLIQGIEYEHSIGYAPDRTTTRAELATVLMRFDQAVPAAAYAEEIVSIDVAEQDKIPAHAVPGTLCAPADTEGKKLPAVVMLHGTGSSRDEAGDGYKMAAPVMAENDIVTLRIDFMGNGDSEASYTDYNYTSANIDAKAAADYLAGLDYVDADKIAVMGWSQGGTNALLAAAAYPETFKAVVTWSGALDLGTMFEDFDKAYDTAKANGSFEMTFDWRDPLLVGERWFQEVKDTDVLEAIKDMETPVFALNGDLDDTVPMDNAVAIKNAVKNGTAFIIDGADHTYNVFSGDFSALYRTVNAGIGFLQMTLNGKVGPARVASQDDWGDVYTDMPLAVFEGAGFERGDILKVTVGEKEALIPFCTTYSNVDNGKPLVITDPDGNVTLSYNMDSFTDQFGVQADTLAYFEMGEKEGYLEEYTIRNINSLRTNVREDYDSDEAFANFRPVTMGDIADGVLYRSSSPVNPELGRNTYSDALIKAAGVKTILDLADTEEEYEAYEGVKDSYAYTTNTVKVGISGDISSAENAAKLKAGLEYIIANEGPYMVHCTEGKDRAGFVIMVMECLMGAKIDEMVDDHMLSYENYFHVEKDSDRWNRLAEGTVYADLLKLTGAESKEALAKVDFRKAAETYLTETVGLSAEQVTALRSALSGK